MGGTYEDLEVWQAAMDLVLKIYCASRAFPGDERYGLTNQLRRAGVGGQQYRGGQGKDLR